MPPVGFETTISAGERPKTYALDRAANGTGFFKVTERKTYVSILSITFVWNISHSKKIEARCGYKCVFLFV